MLDTTKEKISKAVKGSLREMEPSAGRTPESQKTGSGRYPASVNRKSRSFYNLRKRKIQNNIDTFLKDTPIEQYNCRVLVKDIFKREPTIILDDIIDKADPKFPCISKLTRLQSECGDGSKLKVSRCNTPQCQFKYKLQIKDKVVSTVTHRIYDCIIPSSIISLNCHSSNLIYLLTCLTCYLQYVGETVQQINERFGIHNTGFRKPEKACCKILANHFNSGKCKNSD